MQQFNWWYCNPQVKHGSDVPCTAWRKKVLTPCKQLLSTNYILPTVKQISCSHLKSFRSWKLKSIQPLSVLPLGCLLPQMLIHKKRSQAHLKPQCQCKSQYPQRLQIPEQQWLSQSPEKELESSKGASQQCYCTTPVLLSFVTRGSV